VLRLTKCSMTCRDCFLWCVAKGVVTLFAMPLLQRLADGNRARRARFPVPGADSTSRSFRRGAPSFSLRLQGCRFASELAYHSHVAHSREPVLLEGPLRCALFGSKLTSGGLTRRASTETPSRPSIASVPQNLEDSAAHRNKSSPFCGLAVWDKDHAVLPIQILDTHPEEFSFVPHSCVAHQDDDVPEKITSPWAPVASQGSHCQFPFRFIVKTKVSSMLFHHFDFRSVADHLPLLRFVKHSSQCSQSAVGICGRARRLQLLGAITCNLVDLQHRNICRL